MWPEQVPGINWFEIARSGPGVDGVGVVVTGTGLGVHGGKEVGRGRSSQSI